MDGMWLLFQRHEPDPGSHQRRTHIYMHDLVTGITEIITRTPSGRPANGPSLRPTLSHDASRIGFQSLACDLVLPRHVPVRAKSYINLPWDVFVL